MQTAYLLCWSLLLKLLLLLQLLLLLVFFLLELPGQLQVTEGPRGSALLLLQGHRYHVVLIPTTPIRDALMGWNAQWQITWWPHLVNLPLLLLNTGRVGGRGSSLRITQPEIWVTEVSVTLNIMKRLPDHRFLLQEALIRHQQIEVPLRGQNFINSHTLCLVMVLQCI